MQQTTPKSPLQRYGALIALLAVVAAGTFLLYRSSGTSQPAAPAAPPASDLPIVTIAKPLLHVDRITVGPADVPVAATITASAAQPIAILGWAVDGKAGSGATGIILLVDDTTRIPALFGGVRPDVAAAFKNPAYERSAFDGVIPANSLSPGDHRIGMLIQSADRSTDYKVPQILSVKVSP